MTSVWQSSLLCLAYQVWESPCKFEAIAQLAIFKSRQNSKAAAISHEQNRS